MNTAMHNDFEAEVADYITSKGGMVQTWTYHECFRPEALQAMSRCFSMPAMRIRLQPDMVAFSPDRSKVVFVEAKAPRPRAMNGGRSEFQIEAMQAAFNVQSGGCVYAVRWEGHEFGWSCDSFQERWIREIRIPVMVRRGRGEFDRQTPENYFAEDGFGFYKQHIQRAFPRATIKDSNSSYPCGGSGDPYIVFDASVPQSLPDWREVIDAKLGLSTSVSITTSTNGSIRLVSDSDASW